MVRPTATRPLHPGDRMYSCSARALRGPNRWTRTTALEIDVEVGDALDTDTIRLVEGRLRERLPALTGATLDAEAPAPARWIAWAVWGLQCAAGSTVGFVRVAPTPT